MKVQNLEIKYLNFKSEYNKDPKGILMSPNKYEELRREAYVGGLDFDNSGLIEFRGVKIYRSFDINTDEIEIF
jgi:hypothetical protein